MFFQVIRVNTINVVDTSTDFSNTNKLCSSLNEELWCPVSHITETLNDECFASDTLLNSKLFSRPCVVKQLPCGIKHTQTGGFSSSTDTTLSFPFSCCYSISIDVGMAVIFLIGRFHPGHFLFTSSKIWTRDVNCSSERVLLCKLNCVLSSDSLKFLYGIVFRVDGDAALSATVRQVDDWTLDAH